MDPFPAAALAGACGVVVSHPLDVVRTKHAACSDPKTTALQIGRDVFRSRGLRGAYAGVLSPILSVGLWKGATLATQRRALDCLGGDRPRDVFLASVGAGCVGAVVVTPAEVLKTRAQCAGWFGLAAELRGAASLSAAELARAARLLVARDGLGTGVFLGSYTFVHDALQRRGWGVSERAAVAGAIAGPLGWLGIYPIEIARIQMQQAPGLPATPVAAARALARRHGLDPRFWWRGCGTCCARSVLQIPVTMMVFENVVAAAYRTR